MKKQKKQGSWVIHLRHIFPAAADLLLLILMFVPSFRFSISSELQPKQSVFDLISNAWKGSREYLFSASAQTTPQGEVMYRAIFIALIALILLFALGMAINIFSMIVSYKDMIAPEENKNLKNAYLAFIPNRIVLCMFRLLVIPIHFLPDIVARYYRTKLFQAVSVKYILLHPAIIAAILFVITAVIVLIARKHEISENRDIFFKRNAQTSYDDASDQEDAPHERVYRIDESDNTAEKLRRMFEDKDK